MRHVHEHDGGQIPEYHEWYVPGRMSYRDSLGLAGASTHPWMVLECNNPDCLGEAIVSLTDFTDGIPLGEVLPDSPGTRAKFDDEMRKLEHDG